jgi:preprotein translocase subunit SecA
MFKKIFGNLLDSNEKEINKLRSFVEKEINSLEPEFERLSDEELKGKTAEFRKHIAEATQSISREIENLNTELEEAKQRVSEAVNDLQKQELEKNCENLKKDIKKKNRETKEVEKKALEELLPQAFAAVREAAKRTIHQRHYDEQLIGGIILHEGKIAEMKTGEGKTLVATCPLYLNSLTGRGVHLVTVNDYLARRDPYWMGPVFYALGITVASIYPMQNPDEHTPARLFDPDHDSGDKTWPHFRAVTRKEAYGADITYGTSSEFGFDYLRDNMVIDLSQCVQKKLNYAIVDEVDNLLIDEARTPLIISGQAEEAGDIYKAVNSVVNRMKFKVLPHEPVTPEEKEEEAQLFEDNEFDFVAYEKEHTVKETHRGQERTARAFGYTVDDLFGGGMEEKAQHSFEEAKKINDILSISRKSMQAHSLYRRDRDYVVNENGEVIIVDEFTGRLMLGRRYSEGLHQAIEAKEGVKIQRESRTFATITIQNYFRMYDKLAGMTGTAMTEAEEFSKIYKLESVVIPTHRPMARIDHQDRIYKDENAKFKAIAGEIEEIHKTGQPVLVGTVSIEKSEKLSGLLKRKGIKHNVLNAKKHTEEARIISEAGKPGAVTIATNMAGRGVDIVLGGREPEKPETGDPQAIKEWEKAHKEWEENHELVKKLGGLNVIGTERHESRRIDNQLRGRAGRQGDPGSTRFFVGLDDDIMKRFGGERIKSIMNWVGLDEDTPIENRMVSKSIENSQTRVEGFHFDIRKHLVEYDDVVNKHRELIYQERRKILEGADLKANILDMVEKEIRAVVDEYIGKRTEDEWNIEQIVSEVNNIFPLPKNVTAESLKQLSSEEIEDRLIDLAHQVYEQKEKETGEEDMRLLERLVMLRIIDSLWVEHLTRMEEQRQQAAFATLQQMKSQDSYKRIGFEQFQILLDTIRYEVTRMIYKVGIRREVKTKMSTPISRAAEGANKKVPTAPRVGGKKIGRNDPCPCGSGKKYKHCCGR